jgi:hypothetical protein
MVAISFTLFTMILCCLNTLARRKSEAQEGGGRRLKSTISKYRGYPDRGNKRPRSVAGCVANLTTTVAVPRATYEPEKERA